MTAGRTTKWERSYVYAGSVLVEGGHSDEPDDSHCHIKGLEQLGNVSRIVVLR